MPTPSHWSSGSIVDAVDVRALVLPAHDQALSVVDLLDENLDSLADPLLPRAAR